MLQLALPQESTLSFIFWGTFKIPKPPILKNILLKVVLAPCLKMFKGENMVYNFCWFNLKTTFFIFHFFLFLLTCQKKSKRDCTFLDFSFYNITPLRLALSFFGRGKKVLGAQKFFVCKNPHSFPVNNLFKEKLKISLKNPKNFRLRRAKCLGDIWNFYCIV